VVNPSVLPTLQDIQVELQPSLEEPNTNRLIIKLLSSQYKDVFSILAEDLVTSVSRINDEERLIKELLNRFGKWESLFDKARSPGLTPEEQRGLYGELYCLRKLLSTGNDFHQIVNSWVGTERELRDFQKDGWCIEVKTTQSNNHQRILISSERQLDTKNFEYFFLFHLSLEVRHDSGETLNEIVDSIEETLNANFNSLIRFRNKLIEGGYFRHHREMYEGTGYFIRHEAFYQVSDDFPRIEEQDIREGVGDVKYSIILSNCEQYLRTESETFNKLTF
jgi:hypothetical protein